nr:CD109 antigen-like [Vicugna pacos]
MGFWKPAVKRKPYLSPSEAQCRVPGRPKFLVTAPGIIRPGRNVTVGVELLEHSPSQITVKVELVKMSASLTISVLEAEGVFEKGEISSSLALLQ